MAGLEHGLLGRYDTTTGGRGGGGGGVLEVAGLAAFKQAEVVFKLSFGGLLTLFGLLLITMSARLKPFAWVGLEKPTSP